MQPTSVINFNTSNQTLRQLLGNGLTYTVPRFQRDYSWTETEWDDLWQDILIILPENPDKRWEQFTDSQVEQFVYRLGNMTLLQASANRGLGNQSFVEKCPVFAASEFEITRSVPQDNDEWTEERIAQRQRWMAKQATAIWRIAQLS